MKEVKSPRKPLIYYYFIVLIILSIFNMIVMPMITGTRVVETDYSKFMQMIEEKDIGKVEISTNEIVFTDKKEDKTYKTGVINDLSYLISFLKQERNFHRL